MPLRIINTFVLLLFSVSLALGQRPFSADYDGIASVIQLDSLVISARQQGFNVEAFIEILQEDQSFYQAFKNLHFFEYKANHKILFYSKRGKPVASFRAQTRQIMQSDSCRRMIFTSSPEVQGKFFRRKGEHRYTTAELYEKVFFTAGTKCEQVATGKQEIKGLQRYYEALKTFIFQPGERVEVPLISKKTALFDPELMPYYDYFIGRHAYRDGTDCYVFTIQVKEDYQDRKEGKTLIKYLKTYFRSSDFQVLGRTYTIENQGLASCSVRMEVQLTNYEGVYLPAKVSYDGTWNIPGKKRETGQFEAVFSDYSR